MESKLADVTAVILAGGTGTRLRSVVSDRAKPIAEVNGRPFITYLLDDLAAVGVGNVLLCTGYKAEHVQETLGEQYQDMQLDYSVEPSPLGTAGALRHALPKITRDTLLVLNGDSYCTSSIREFHHDHVQRMSEATIELAHVSDAGDYGSVELDDHAVVTAFSEKNADIGAGWINAGRYLLATHLLHSIPEDHPVSLETEMFPDWITYGLYAHRGDGQLLDIGTPERYAQAADFLSTHRGEQVA